VQPLLQWKSSYVLHILSVCLCNHAKSMHHVILSSVALQVLPHFPTFSYKRQEFRKKAIKHKVCVLIFSIKIVWNVSYLRIIQRDIVIETHRPPCKVFIILVSL